MSICLFVIRNIHKMDSLNEKLIAFAESRNFGIDFHPTDILITHHQIPLQKEDFIFSLCDSFVFTSCDCVLYPEGDLVNGREHPLSFTERMMTIQQVAEIALQYSEEVELFLSDDNPYLPEFTNYDLNSQNVAITLIREYAKCQLPYATIPSVFMIIRRGDKGTVLLSPNEDENRA